MCTCTAIFSVLYIAATRDRRRKKAERYAELLKPLDVHPAQSEDAFASQLLEMAEVKLLELERQASKLAEEQDQEDQQQLSLFVLPKGNQDDKETTLPLEIAQMLERLRSIDPMNITGSESIRILEEMKHAAERNKA